MLEERSARGVETVMDFVELGTSGGSKQRARDGRRPLAQQIDREATFPL